MLKKRKKSTTEKETVLVVEDSEEFSSLLLYIIEDKGYRGLHLAREEEFMDWVRKEQPVAILMDLALLRHDGFQLLAELWKDEELKDIPVLVITGRDLGDEELKLLEEHKAAYLRKGRVPTLDLHKAIQVAAERGKNLRAKQSSQ